MGAVTDYGDAGSDNMVFVPSVSEQRYSFAVSLAKKHQAQKVIDMGCGPCSLFRRLKWLSHVEHLVGVDVDGELLEKQSHSTKPVLGDHLNPRQTLFRASLMQGSIAEFDQRLQDYDLLLCIEVIEHLYEPDLAKVPEVIFGLMRPKRALFTTPNADFNVLFGRMEEEFRHPDHKFEWSRREFQEWCNCTSQKYGYDIEYVGMGKGPKDMEHLGFCTQGAVFTRHDRSNEIVDSDGDMQERKDGANLTKQPYRLVIETDFPVAKKSEIPLHILIEWEVMRCLQGLIASSGESFEEYNELDDIVYRVPLGRLMQFAGLKKLCSGDETILRDVVQSMSCCQLTEDDTAVIYREDDEGSDRSSSLSEEGEEQEQQHSEGDERCWDDD